MLKALLPLAALAILGLSACDARQACQEHYTDSQQIDACIYGANFASNVSNQFSIAGHGGTMAGIAAVRSACASECSIQYPEHGDRASKLVQKACTDSCQVAATNQMAASPSQSN
jgi:hypothetical protein